MTPEGEDGSPDTRAGSHPFQLTTTINLNETLAEYHTGLEEGFFPSAPALARNLHFKLPPGLVADATAVPQCSAVNFSTELSNETNLCPADTAIGVVSALVNLPIEGFIHLAVPVFNLPPSPGEPARLGFLIEGLPVVLDTSVSSGGEYAAEVSTLNTTEGAQLLSSQVTIWGVPGDSRHDASRGWECLRVSLGEEDFGLPCTATHQQEPTAFLTLPTSCASAPQASVWGDSWPTGEPGNDGSVLAEETPPICSPPRSATAPRSPSHPRSACSQNSTPRAHPPGLTSA